MLGPRGAGEGYYFEARACVIDPDTLATAATSELALAIVHEATHARLHRLGIGYEPERRARIERICLSAERDLAVRFAESGIDVELPSEHAMNPWWTEEALEARREDALRQAGAPGWLIGAWSR